MLCIIAGHMGIDIVNKIVFTFHVPIFFLISGYFISQELTFKEYAKKRVHGLVLPYLFTSLLLIIARIFIDVIKGDTTSILPHAKMVFIQAMYGSGTNSNATLFGIHQIGAIWFLLALLWALLLVKYFINKRYGWLWIFCIATVSYITSQYCWLPWDIQAGGTASIFVFIGAYFRKLNKKIVFKNWLIILGSIVLILEVICNIRVSVVSNYYKYTLVSIAGAILISYVILWISKLLDKTKIIKKALCFLGANSIIILCFHLIELNNVPWWYLYNFLGDLPCILKYLLYLICYTYKLLFVIISTKIVLNIKWLRKVFAK